MIRSPAHAASILKKMPGTPEAREASAFLNTQRYGVPWHFQLPEIKAVRKELAARIREGRDAYVVRNLLEPPWVVVEGNAQLRLYLWVRGVVSRWQYLLYKARLIAHKRDETRMQRKRLDPLPGSAYPMNGIRRG